MAHIEESALYLRRLELFLSSTAARVSAPTITGYFADRAEKGSDVFRSDRRIGGPSHHGDGGGDDGDDDDDDDDDDTAATNSDDGEDSGAGVDPSALCGVDGTNWGGHGPKCDAEFRKAEAGQWITRDADGLCDVYDEDPRSVDGVTTCRKRGAAAPAHEEEEDSKKKSSHAYGGCPLYLGAVLKLEQDNQPSHQHLALAFEGWEGTVASCDGERIHLRSGLPATVEEGA